MKSLRRILFASDRHGPSTKISFENFLRKLDTFALKLYTLGVRKLAGVLTVAVYLGFSNYCLTYAVMTGKAHCLPAPADPSHSHSDHEHGAGHDDHGEAPAHHDHSPDSSGDCCVQLSVAVQSAPQLLAAAVVSFDFLYVIVPETTVSAEALFRRTDHGPPKPAEQDVSLAYRASRAPPALA